MHLKFVDFSEWVGTPNEWTLEGFMPKKINLIVGKNASGKTRTLNIIGNLGNVIAGNKPLFTGSAYFDIQFNDNSKLQYLLKVKESKIIEEKLIKDHSTLLDRGLGGIGKIFAVKLDNFIDFQAPDNVLACSVRRDSDLSPFIVPL